MLATWTVDASDNTEGTKSDSVGPFCVTLASNPSYALNVLSLAAKLTFVSVTLCHTLSLCFTPLLDERPCLASQVSSTLVTEFGS